MLLGHAFLAGLAAMTGLVVAFPAPGPENGVAVVALSARSPEANALANPEAAKELVARANNDPIPPVPILVFLAAAFFNAGRMFITPLREQPFTVPNTLAPLNTQFAGADLLNGLVATAVAAGTAGPLTVRFVPLVQNRPFRVALTLDPYPGLTWAQIAQNAGGTQGLQLLVAQAVNRAITGNVESGTYQLNVRVQNNPTGQQPLGFGVATLNIQIEGRSVFED